MWKILASILLDRTKEYLTTALEDKKMLNSGTLDQNMWNVVNLRRGEK